MSVLARGFIAATLAWAAALPLAAAAVGRFASLGSVGQAFALAIYAAGSLVCHQRPERSFHLLGVQLPVCARCLGIYLGAAGAAVLVSLPPSRHRMMTAMKDLARRPDGLRALRTLLVIAALPALVTLLLELTGGPTGNLVRALSGAPIGAAVVWAVCAIM